VEYSTRNGLFGLTRDLTAVHRACGKLDILVETKEDAKKEIDQ
jgi:hypothetical protein